jgi:hypothetical protein
MPYPKISYSVITVLSIAAFSYGFYCYKGLATHNHPQGFSSTATTTESFVHTGKYVLIHLDTEVLELRDGTTTLKTVPLVSQGKPGSYYETIGGTYINDYKELNHFSSIGHVYMPYSVHLFGNYFIHGIPYYPDGTKVSSTYSGGCIRIADDDARSVYTFVTTGVPIIITRNTEYEFSPTATSTVSTQSMDMTNQMVAIISLEVLTQDNKISDTDGVSITTRRTLIPRILSGETSVHTLISSAVGEVAFVDYMNQKARTLGLTNTTFSGATLPANTTGDDQTRFMNYITTYKSYLTRSTIPPTSPLVYR